MNLIYMVENERFSLTGGQWVIRNYSHLSPESSCCAPCCPKSVPGTARGPGAGSSPPLSGPANINSTLKSICRRCKGGRGEDDLKSVDMSR